MFFYFLESDEMVFPMVFCLVYENFLHCTCTSGPVVLCFYNSKNLNCIGALSFFKICSHIFMILKSIWSSDFVTPKQEVKQKICGMKFFCSYFKVEGENGF